jgi:ribosomal peptide maturation radical SAM protein 1
VVKQFLPDPSQSPRAQLKPRPAHPLRIALVNMPWARAETPSIQCGLLKAALVADGHQVDVHYLNLDLAAALGPGRYTAISDLDSERVHMLGEWLFTAAAFGQAADPRGYLRAYPGAAPAARLFGADMEQLRVLREETLPAWIGEHAARTAWADYDLVGLTSTFEQNVAALALAAAIKRVHPGVPVVFGGANFDGEMGQEFFRVFPWIDYAVTGEGDVALPALAAALASGDDPARVPGVCARLPDGQPAPVRYPAGPPAHMDSLPVPDYDDYFAALRRLGRVAVLGDRSVRLLAEFSRGCWWGQKHHCTFCGLNALGMTFRSKSADRAVADLVHLTSRYHTLRVEAVDNILDMGYLRTFCADIAGQDLDLDLFFEVKANLNREQIGVLSRAGVSRIQPGLESLSTHILRLMRKGTTMLLNVRLLKWAAYYGVGVTWNMLMGFPGEHDEDYRRQAALLPALHHLQPPGGSGQLWMERYSPYFTDPALGLPERQPRRAYQFLYPVPGIDLNKIAYFFEYVPERTAGSAAHALLASAVDAWRDAWEKEPPELTHQRGPGYLRIYDTRGERPRQATLTGWRADALLRCGDTARSPARVADDLVAGGHRVGADRVARFLDECVAGRIAVNDDDQYLSVVLPRRRGA